LLTFEKSTKEINWIAKMLESSAYENLSNEQVTRAHKLILESEVFDHYMHKKFPSVKRYGLEGSESMIYAIDVLFKTLAETGTTDVVLGMPHRGRLNLLTGLLKYPARALFHKLKGNSEFPPELQGTGDVISHIGISTELDYGKKLAVSLITNPSHLEAINPVAEGKTRAKIQQGKHACCVLMHGGMLFIFIVSLILFKMLHFALKELLLKVSLFLTWPIIQYKEQSTLS
jgi:probable 2-oxoglutarate dehydrogenase E1 component DHKTD1